ncbi:DMT family transporter [Neptunicella marina]|uniref:DMT family transporter n=1 Tax=Neptunicella marina TaxID=2125989 RepID=A0A8J6IYP0_9ALTE|nr:DMT family transporter [Neptunicella marina]MBC3767655.1 DMT family transporter [Neptunicella marina]
MNRQSTTSTLILLLISVFCWGSVFPFSKPVLESMSQQSLVIWRFSIASLCLIIYLLVKRQPWPHLRFGQYLWLAFISVLGVGGFNLLLFTGIKHTAATNGALVMALSPLVTALMVAGLARKWISRAQSFSLLVGLFGVLLVITNGSWQRLMQFQFNQGDITVIAAMLLWSAYTTASQKVTSWLPVIPFTLISLLTGDIFILIASAIQGDIHPIQELINLSGGGIVSVVYIGIFGTVVGYLFFLNGVQKLGSATASLFFNFIPVFAALTAMMMGQSVTPIQLSGMAIVLIGLSLPPLLRTMKQRRTNRLCEVN